MNRGYNGNKILSNAKEKYVFLNILKTKLKKLNIKLLCYCIMDNHYHLIVQNKSGLLSDFMRQVNSEYAIYYRKKYGGKGYVFQNRYKSTLIQKNQYLQMAILYVLLNPVRAKITKDAFKYKWSSIKLYFLKKTDKIIDTDFINEIFQTKENLINSLNLWQNNKIKAKPTPLGPILGNDGFINEAIKKYDRRKNDGEILRKRKNDYSFELPEKIIKKFEKDHGIKLEKIDIHTKHGRDLRSKFIVKLRNKGGLKYSEIIKYPIFKDLKYSSLGQIYKRTVKKS